MVETTVLLNRRRLDEKRVLGIKPDGRSAFSDLIARLAARVPELDAARLADGGPFMYGPWVVCLTYEPDLALDCVIVHLDAGPLPASDPASAAIALLEANHESCLQRSGFSISPLTGHAVYSEALALENLSIDDLLAAFERGAQHAARLATPD